MNQIGHVTEHANQTGGISRRDVPAVSPMFQDMEDLEPQLVQRSHCEKDYHSAQRPVAHRHKKQPAVKTQRTGLPDSLNCSFQQKCLNSDLQFLRSVSCAKSHRDPSQWNRGSEVQQDTGAKHTSGPARTQQGEPPGVEPR